MSIDRVYKDGDIVWVKFGSSWWPGEVTGAHRQPENLLQDLKRQPYCVVKFFHEDAYEYVKTGKQMFHYQCSMKEEFIKKGLALYNAKKKFMEKFPSDIEYAEQITGNHFQTKHDILIVNDRPDSIVKAILGQTLITSHDIMAAKDNEANGSTVELTCCEERKNSSSSSNRSGDNPINNKSTHCRKSVTKILNIMRNHAPPIATSTPNLRRTQENAVVALDVSASQTNENSIASRSTLRSKTAKTAAGNNSTVKAETPSRARETSREGATTLRTTTSQTLNSINNTAATPVAAAATNSLYRCSLCDFTSLRQNVIIFHRKSHRGDDGLSSSLNNDSHANKARTPNKIINGAPGNGRQQTLSLPLINIDLERSTTVAVTAVVAKELNTSPVAKAVHKCKSSTTQSTAPNIDTSNDEPHNNSSRSSLTLREHSPGTPPPSAVKLQHKETRPLMSAKKHETSRRLLRSSIQPACTEVDQHRPSTLDQAKERSPSPSITLPVNSDLLLDSKQTIGDGIAEEAADESIAHRESASSPIASPPRDHVLSPSVTPTSVAKKRNSEEIRRSLLADWSDEDKEYEAETDLKRKGGGLVTQRRRQSHDDHKVMDSSSSSVACPESIDVMAAIAPPTCSSPPLPPATVNADSKAKIKSKHIRNIPKKDRREAVLKEFSDDLATPQVDVPSCGVLQTESVDQFEPATTLRVTESPDLEDAAKDMMPTVDMAINSRSPDSADKITTSATTPEAELDQNTPSPVKHTIATNDVDAPTEDTPEAAPESAVPEPDVVVKLENTSGAEELPLVQNANVNTTPQKPIGQGDGSCFDFEDEDDIIHQQTAKTNSIGNFKAMYSSQLRQQQLMGTEVEQLTVAESNGAGVHNERKEMELNDRSLALDIDLVLKQTTPIVAGMSMLLPELPKPVQQRTSRDHNDDEMETDVAAVKTLPIKERGKRIFKSRNRSPPADDFAPMPELTNKTAAMLTVCAQEKNTILLNTADETKNDDDEDLAAAKEQQPLAAIKTTEHQSVEGAYPSAEALAGVSHLNVTNAETACETNNENTEPELTESVVVMETVADGIAIEEHDDDIQPTDRGVIGENVSPDLHNAERTMPDNGNTDDVFVETTDLSLAGKQKRKSKDPAVLHTDDWATSIGTDLEFKAHSKPRHTKKALRQRPENGSSEDRVVVEIPGGCEDNMNELSVTRPATTVSPSPPSPPPPATSPTAIEHSKVMSPTKEDSGKRADSRLATVQSDNNSNSDERKLEQSEQILRMEVTSPKPVPVDSESVQETSEVIVQQKRGKPSIEEVALVVIGKSPTTTEGNNTTAVDQYEPPAKLVRNDLIPTAAAAAAATDNAALSNDDEKHSREERTDIIDNMKQFDINNLQIVISEQIFLNASPADQVFTAICSDADGKDLDGLNSNVNNGKFVILKASTDAELTTAPAVVMEKAAVPGDSPGEIIPDQSLALFEPPSILASEQQQQQFSTQVLTDHEQKEPLNNSKADTPGAGLTPGTTGSSKALSRKVNPRQRKSISLAKTEVKAGAKAEIASRQKRRTSAKEMELQVQRQQQQQQLQLQLPQESSSPTLQQTPATASNPASGSDRKRKSNAEMKQRAKHQKRQQQQQQQLQEQEETPQVRQDEIVHSTTVSEEQSVVQVKSEQIDGTSNILAVPTQPIAGYNETFLLCTLANNNYKPIDNIPLYLNHELNQLVPVPMEALTEQIQLAVSQPTSVCEERLPSAGEPANGSQTESMEEEGGGGITEDQTETGEGEEEEEANVEKTVQAADSTQLICLPNTLEATPASDLTAAATTTTRTSVACNKPSTSIAAAAAAAAANGCTSFTTTTSTATTTIATTISSAAEMLESKSRETPPIAQNDDDAPEPLDDGDGNSESNLLKSNDLAIAEGGESGQIGNIFMPAESPSEMLSDNAVILNIEGQEIILDAATFTHLLANPDANMQLITDDGAEFVLTRDVLAALEVQQDSQSELTNEQQQPSVSFGQHRTGLNVDDGGVSGGTDASDMLAVALSRNNMYSSEMLEVETSQGLHLMHTDDSLMFHPSILPTAHLTPPITAKTSETSTLLNQTPIMSTLEKPSLALAGGALPAALLGGSTTHGMVDLGVGGGNAELVGLGILGGSSSSSSFSAALGRRPNLDDSLAVIGVSTQSSTVPSSLELPITVTNPAIAPKYTLSSATDHLTLPFTRTHTLSGLNIGEAGVCLYGAGGANGSDAAS